jgi:hypothetical protein
MNMAIGKSGYIIKISLDYKGSFKIFKQKIESELIKIAHKYIIKEFKNFEN